MPGEAFERKLAAILAADIAGYSRLVGLDEEGTLARLLSLRREAALPQERRIAFRVGINLGDIVVRGDDNGSRWRCRGRPSCMRRARKRFECEVAHTSTRQDARIVNRKQTAGLTSDPSSGSTRIG